MTSENCKACGGTGCDPIVPFLDCEACQRPGPSTYTSLSAPEQPTPLEVAHKYDDTLLPFLSLMRRELHANAGKGDRPGWLAMTRGECLLEIFYHMGKLQKAVKKNDDDGVLEYAADVANMCMMLVDICGLFGLTEQPAQVAVVLPARIAIKPHWPEWKRSESQGWNNCLDASLSLIRGAVANSKARDV